MAISTTHSTPLSPYAPPYPQKLYPYPTYPTYSCDPTTRPLHPLTSIYPLPSNNKDSYPTLPYSVAPMSSPSMSSQPYAVASDFLTFSIPFHSEILPIATSEIIKFMERIEANKDGPSTS